MKKGATGGGIDAGEGNATAGDDFQAVERDGFVGAGLGEVRVPVGIAVRALDEVGRDGLYPLRGNGRDGSGVCAGGFDDLGGHDPLGGFLEEG